jgi:amino acid adenylation domain-containing protein
VKPPSDESLSERIARLSPERRRALERLLIARKAPRGAAPDGILGSQSGPRVAPLSFSQERVWFTEQMAPGNALFNLRTAFRIRGISAAVLERALSEIVRRHESLRTTFGLQDGRPVQRIGEALPVAVPVVDLSATPPTEREAQARAQAQEEVGRPFDLERGPLLRVLLIDLGEEDFLFVLTVHHIVSDGWSMGVFFQELSTLYRDLASGRSPSLAPLRLQYADFATWQRERLRGEALEAQVGYWRAQLADLPALELPCDRRRPALPSYRGSRHPVALPAALARRVKEFAKTEGATPYMVLLAAFDVLLYRYSGQEDLAVGTYSANRNRVELEGLIGFFINTLVMRADLSGRPSFRQVVARTRESAMEAYAHQDLPFTTLVEQLQPDRDMSRNPFFQAVFHLYNVPSGGLSSSSDYRVEGAWLEHPTAAFDLTLTLQESSGTFVGELEYSTDLFEASTAAALAEHYQLLLEAALGEPDRPVAELPLLTAAERARLGAALVLEAAPQPAADSVVARFGRVAAATPDTAAMRCEGRTLSYGDLDRRSAALAARLQEAGVRPGGVVGVCLPRSLDAAVALLAVWKSGAVYLPLDPTYPRDRLAFMQSDAAAHVVIACAPEADWFAGTRSVGLDGLDEDPLPSLALPAPDAEAPAFIMYTSGSTGTPKGIVAPHRQLLNRLDWLDREQPLGLGEVGCQKTPLSFIDSIWELVGPLLQQRLTVILPDVVVQDLDALVSELAAAQVSRLWLVPSLLKALLDRHPDLGDRLPALRLWVATGEALPRDLAQRFHSALPEASLFNLYGTSEVWDVSWQDMRSEPVEASHVGVGRPIPGVVVLVVDSAGGAVPIGAMGELAVGGAALPLGHVNRPDLDAARFIPDPLRPGERLFRTGDLGRLRRDGVLELLGRSEREVKVRGHRVDLGEIECLLRQTPGVADAVVVAEEDDERGARLLAYVMSSAGPEAVWAELVPTCRRFLERKLPEALVPSVFVALERIPLTPSGKVDRRALPPPDPLSTRSAPPALPRTPLEQRLVEIFREVLRVPVVGVHDHLFSDLGAHSLLATQLLSRIGDRLGAGLPVRTLFEHPTVASLAEQIEIAIRAGGSLPASAEPIRPVQRDKYRLAVPPPSLD